MLSKGPLCTPVLRHYGWWAALPLGLGLAKLEFLWVMLRLDTMAKEVSSVIIRYITTLLTSPHR